MFKTIYQGIREVGKTGKEVYEFLGYKGIIAIAAVYAATIVGMTQPETKPQTIPSNLENMLIIDTTPSPCSIVVGDMAPAEDTKILVREILEEEAGETTKPPKMIGTPGR